MSISDQITLTLQEVKDYLRVDYDDDDTILERFISTAKSRASKLINRDEISDDDVPLVETACLKMIASWYEYRDDSTVQQKVESESLSQGEIPHSAYKLLSMLRKFY
mgnify:FL=1